MRKVLLIEDDLDLYQLLQYNLERAGFRFTGSNTGKGAVELCLKERPDLILLDIMLPDSSGFEICARLRNHAAMAGAPIIFLTARGSEADRVMGLEMGANDYIVKPFSIRVNSACEGSTASYRNRRYCPTVRKAGIGSEQVPGVLQRRSDPTHGNGVSFARIFYEPAWYCL